MGRRLPLLVAWLLPLSSAAQAVVVEEGEGQAEEIGWGGEVGVIGGPLDLSHLGKRPRPQPVEETSPYETEPFWGLRETEFQLVPAGTARPRLHAGSWRIPGPPWPGPSMVEAWDLGAAFSFPRLAPSIGAEFFSFVGERDDTTIFSERVRVDLYFVELAVNALGSVGNERLDRTDMDLDFRIPVRLGRKHRLALMPGSTFPIDGRRNTDDDTAIRFQVLYGIGGAGLGLQARLGVVQGMRTRGLLHPDESVRDPALLYGALLAWRFVPGIQIRAEGSGEFARDGGTDHLTLLGGPVFFPFGDPRISLGTLGIVETRGEDLDFERPAWGGLIQLGIGFF